MPSIPEGALDIHSATRPHVNDLSSLTIDNHIFMIMTKYVCHFWIIDFTMTNDSYVYYDYLVRITMAPMHRIKFKFRADYYRRMRRHRPCKSKPSVRSTHRPTGTATATRLEMMNGQLRPCQLGLRGYGPSLAGADSTSGPPAAAHPPPPHSFQPGVPSRDSPQGHCLFLDAGINASRKRTCRLLATFLSPQRQDTWSLSLPTRK